jgi:hypothetical protein
MYDGSSSSLKVCFVVLSKASDIAAMTSSTPNFEFRSFSAERGLFKIVANEQKKKTFQENISTSGDEDSSLRPACDIASLVPVMQAAIKVWRLTLRRRNLIEFFRVGF